MLFHPCSVDCVREDQRTQSHRGLLMSFTSVVCLQLTLLAAVKGPGQVGVYHGLPALGGHVLCWAAELTSSVVHQEVYPAVLLQHCGH